MATNVPPHNVDDSGSDERVLDDARVEVGGSVLYDAAHDVDAVAGGAVIHRPPADELLGPGRAPQ